MEYESLCDHEWIKIKETHTTGENLTGQIVTCWGWDTYCNKCIGTSWIRNNQKEEHEKQ